jgi:hypothetical protein
MMMMTDLPILAVSKQKHSIDGVGDAEDEDL